MFTLTPSRNCFLFSKSAWCNALRVLIGTFGTRGDVQPLVALGKKLQARGHDVTVVVPPNATEWVSNQGLRAEAAGIDYRALAEEVADGRIRLSSLKRIRGEVLGQLHAMEPLAAKADVLVGSAIFAVGEILAQQFNIPYVFVSLIPQIFPSDEHPMLAFKAHDMPAWVNRISWKGNEVLWNLFLRGEMNRARGARGLGSIKSAYSSLFGQHVLLAADQHLGPAPSDFVVPIHQVGAWFLEGAEGLSQEVEQFLNAGPAPVYIGFGSMADPNPMETTERLLDSVSKARVRAIISRGWAGLDATNCPADVLLVGSEPHSLLFPRCSAVVHHGGAGTTHAAARAGVPQIVMPQVMDQFYWSMRVQKLGIGPKPVARYSRNSQLLADAILECMENEQMKANARGVSRLIQTDGLEKSMEYIERLVVRQNP